MKKIALLMASASLAINSLAMASCPDYTSVKDLPNFPEVKEVSFHHLTSKLVSALYSPYHMAYDVVMTANESSQMIAKFDYDLALHKDLEDEEVQAFLYGTGMETWQTLGHYTTNDDGKIYVPLSNLPEGEYAVHLVVKGDLSSTTGFVSVISTQQDAVLFDIDGTLTLNDFEAVGDYLGIRDAQAYYYAPETVNAYKEKGYQILYLSARPYWLTKNSREWLNSNGLLQWHLHTNSNAELFESTDKAQYKADYIQQLTSKGLNIIRAYGNADTDIQAYADAGIAKADTYIIGDNAGKEGTQALTDDYSYHYSTVVASTPDANCKQP